jgi:hypothetical protein
MTAKVAVRHRTPNRFGYESRARESRSVSKSIEAAQPIIQDPSNPNDGRDFANSFHHKNLSNPRQLSRSSFACHDVPSFSSEGFDQRLFFGDQEEYDWWHDRG